MKLFDLESPLMQGLSKFADLMWLNILTILCCIPIFTMGASFTAMHYMALKIVRNEECYITQGFFKSFKENFRQATVIWVMILVAVTIIATDLYILGDSTALFSIIVRIVILAAALLILLTATCVFPVLAKFANTTPLILRSAFIMSVLQLPKTLLIIVANIAPFLLGYCVTAVIPIVIMYCFSAPAFLAALLYNKFFKNLEEKIEAANAPAEPLPKEPEDPDKIFSDKLWDNTDI